MEKYFYFHTCVGMYFISMYILEMFWFLKFISYLKKENTKMLLTSVQNCKKNLKVHCTFPIRQTVVNVCEEQTCNRQ